MIPTQIKGGKTEFSDKFETKTVGIDKKSLSFILQILRNNIYSDKIGAVVKEPVTNAFDEHIRLNKEHIPIEIDLPSSLSPEFRVRDYGRGLSKEQVFHFFGNYGTSDKRWTNEMAGMMGIGCFAPFCYTSSYSIISYYNGKKFIFSNIIDSENQDGKLVLMDETDTDEENGVMISVPVNYNDFYKFQDTVLRQLKYIKSPYKIDGTLVELQIPEAFQKKDYAPLNGSYDCFAVMGNVCYPIDRHIAGISNINGILLYFNIGELDVSASRESLQYNEKTKKSIENKVLVLKADIEDFLIGQKFNTPYEFYKFYNSLSGFVKEIGYSLLNSGKWLFNGANLNKLESFDFEKYPFRLIIASSKWTNDMQTTSIIRYKYHDIDAKQAHLRFFGHHIIIDDFEGSRKSLYLSNVFRKNEIGSFILMGNIPKSKERELAKTLGMKNLNWITRLSQVEADPNYVQTIRTVQKRNYYIIKEKDCGYSIDGSYKEKIDLPIAQFYYIWGTQWKQELQVSAYNLNFKNQLPFKLLDIKEIYGIPDNIYNRKKIANLEKDGTAFNLADAVKEKITPFLEDVSFRELAEWTHFAVNAGEVEFIEKFINDSEIGEYKKRRIEQLNNSFSEEQKLLISHFFDNSTHSLDLTDYSQYQIIKNNVDKWKQKVEKIHFLKYIDDSITRDTRAFQQIKGIIEPFLK